MTDIELQSGIDAFDINNDILKQWQEIVNSLAKLMNVPAALIMRLNEKKIEVLRTSHSKNNPYKLLDNEHFFNSGLYCETVIRADKRLYVPDALKDEDWKDNPDIALNMISYLGFPIKHADSTPFGTLCILDDHERTWSSEEENVIIQFRNMIENHLELITTVKQISVLNDSLAERVEREVKKNRQQQLMMFHQSRLAQMGELISMIAHQWRQPLNNLSLLNQSVKVKYAKTKLNDEFMEYFDENSNKQIQNMSKTIDDFRDFFRPEKEKIEFYFDDVVLDILSMTKPIYSKDQIVIKFEKEEKYKVFGYPNELGQAILNIINNARDALIENSIENKNIFISLSGDDNKVILTIKDNAGGIPTDVIDKIFDPYFSTKEEKNGTGLGLYMSKLIIDDHMNGKIQVSNKDNGALFEIILREGESNDIE